MAEIQLNKVYQYNDIILLLRYLFSFEWSETKFLEKKWSGVSKYSTKSTDTSMLRKINELDICI